MLSYQNINVNIISAHFSTFLYKIFVNSKENFVSPDVVIMVQIALANSISD